MTTTQRKLCNVEPSFVQYGDWLLHNNEWVRVTYVSTPYNLYDVFAFHCIRKDGTGVIVMTNDKVTIALP